MNNNNCDDCEQRPLKLFVTYPVSLEEFDNTVIPQRSDKPIAESSVFNMPKPSQSPTSVSLSVDNLNKIESPSKGVVVGQQRTEKSGPPTSQSAVVEGQKPSESISVIFQDGGKIETINWYFYYSYAVQDSPPNPFFVQLYIAGSKPTIRTKDLYLGLGQKSERGLMYEDSQLIAGDKLKLIRFGADGIIVTLVDGTTLRIRSLKPSEDLIRKIKGISAEKYIVDTVLYLQGRGCIDNHCGDFMKRIDSFEGIKDPKELIDEIRFIRGSN